MNETQKAIWSKYEAKVRDVAAAIESVRRKTNKKHPISTENRAKLIDRCLAEERSCCRSPNGLFSIRPKHLKSALHCSLLYGADAGRVWGISNRITRQLKHIREADPERALLLALTNIYDLTFAASCLAISNPGDDAQIREAEERIVLFHPEELGPRNPTRELLYEFRELDEQGKDEKSVMSAVESLLRDGANPNARWPSGYTPLHIAIRDERFRFIRALIEAGADVELPDREGKTPLRAAIEQFPNAVPLLLWAGADPNARDADGNTLLHLPKVCDDEIIRLLIIAGGDTNARDKYEETPLHRAITAGRLSLASLLLWSGADPNARDSYSYTPLHCAACTSLEAIDLLLAAGADPNAKSDDETTPLHMAPDLADGESAILALLAAGADPSARDEDGRLPEDYYEGEKGALLVAAREARELERTAAGGKEKTVRRRRI